MTDLRVLLVDDDTAFLEMEQGILEKHLPKGVELTAATGPRQAMEILDAWSIGGVTALVVTDYIMPDMNGMDLIRACHSLYPNSDFTYVCLTTVLHKTVHAKTKQAGAARIEVKPTDLEELRKLLTFLTTGWKDAKSQK